MLSTWRAGVGFNLSSYQARITSPPHKPPVTFPRPRALPRRPCCAGLQLYSRWRWRLWAGGAWLPSVRPPSVRPPAEPHANTAQTSCSCFSGSPPSTRSAALRSHRRLGDVDTGDVRQDTCANKHLFISLQRHKPQARSVIRASESPLISSVKRTTPIITSGRPVHFGFCFFVFFCLVIIWG